MPKRYRKHWPSAFSACLLPVAIAAMGASGGGHGATPATVALPEAASAPSCAPSAQCVNLFATDTGGLACDGGLLAPVLFTPGWGGVRVRPAADPGGTAAEWDVLESGTGRPLFRGRAEWLCGGDGTARGLVSLECVADCAMQTVALALDCPCVPSVGEGDGRASECVANLGGGRSLRLSFGAPVAYHCQDDSEWSGSWSVRFGGHLAKRAFAPGERVEWDVRLSGPGGVSVSRAEPITIAEGPGWSRLEWHRDVEPGSALDFSALGMLDAPAGKHGWLRVRGGAFEFEGLPGMPVRFHGANLCFRACFPDHATADRLVDQLARAGYNSIRIHHHDGIWAKAAFGRRAAAHPSDDIDRLDYLAARAIERGIYLTTDLYVSRTVAWRDLGDDRDGTVPMDLYKTLVGVDAAAFEDWCAYAREFLEHVNPYTGRAWKDEPGLPLISLVNECKLATAWPQKAGDPRVVAAWREFGGEGKPPAPGAPGFAAFEEWVQRVTFGKCAGFVRSLGCRALLTNDNNGARHAPGERIVGPFDYVDNHFYVDHPRFSNKWWSLPSKIDGANPVLAGKPAMLRRGWSAAAGAKPYTASEWNFCGPSRYRAAGGIITGAIAARCGWDGLWRFAYAHDPARIADDCPLGPGYFDAALDPAVAASDRAVASLFLGTVNGEWPEVAIWENKEAGSVAVETRAFCGGFAESGRIDAGPLSFGIAAPGQCPAHKTPGNAGFVPGAPSPGLDASFVPGAPSPGVAVPATLWVSSLDGEPVARSSRMLLAFVTDVQGDGTRFSDATRKEIVAWGSGCLVENGLADVTLRLDDPSAYTVWRLDTSGRRIARVASTPRDGALGFRLLTRGDDGKAAIFWEIARNGR